jgi:hypothetical protein
MNDFADCREDRKEALGLEQVAAYAVIAGSDV